MFRRNKKENKAKLEHKLYLARENPEPVFDISECGISHVPSGIYSLCRVFLKEVLNMSNNYLSSLSGGGNLKDLHLLKVLDISNNSFTALPDEVYLLKGLTEFYINNNQLKKLPSTLCSLEKLKVLSISNNNLRSLPENIGDLIRLQKIVLVQNKHLKELPKSICKAQRLKTIELDSENFLYPPGTVAQSGVESIMKYICDDTGFTYVPPNDLVDAPSSPTDISSTTFEDDNFQAKIWKLEKIKEQKLQEFLEIERNNELLQRQEIELANALKINRQKLLDDITQQQNKFDLELAKIHQEKDVERFKLIEQLKSTEENIEIAVKKLLALNSEPLAQLLEQEREEEQRLIAAAIKYNESLRKDDILFAMQDLLEQETKKFQQLNEDRAETAKSALEQEMLSDSKIAEVLKNKDLEQFELLAKLQEDSDLQKFAVGALLERGDARSWGLVQQVRLVESQLAALTLIEMDRRKLELDDQINDLADKRLNLSILLMDLLDQQNIRRTQLLTTIQSLEDCNPSAEDFWLRQYQRLLDNLPSGLSEAQKNITPALAETLLLAGVIHCLPFLAKWAHDENELLNVTEDDLKEAGVNKSDDRKSILEAFRIYKKTSYEYPSYANAPQVDEEGASAPPIDVNNSYNTSECVICMDQNCQVIFVPCGHYCCCANCSTPLVDCPLCRGTIERKIRVVSP